MRTEDMKRVDLPRLRAGQRDAALREVKASLILEQIADQEKVEVGDEEIEREVEALAHQSKQTIEQVRARLTQDGGWIEFGIASAMKRLWTLCTAGPHRAVCIPLSLLRLSGKRAGRFWRLAGVSN